MDLRNRFYYTVFRFDNQRSIVFDCSNARITREFTHDYKCRQIFFSFISEKKGSSFSKGYSNWRGHSLGNHIINK